MKAENTVVQLILKIRDSVYYFKRQQNPNMAEERLYGEYMWAFFGFIVPILIFISALVARLIGIIFDIQKADPNNWIIVILLSIPVGYIYWKVCNKVFIYLERFPIKEQNDKGFSRNIVFVFSTLSLDFALFVGGLYLIFG